MATWIQSLSWTLIYAVGQGFLVYVTLWLVLKLTPSAPSAFRYHLSLSALTILLTWFGVTWWQQYHALIPAPGHLPAAGTGTDIIDLHLLPTLHGSTNGLRTFLSSHTAVFSWLSGCYLTGLALMLVRLLAGMQQLLSLRTTGISQPAEQLGGLLLSLKKQVGLDEPVQLLLSAKARMPMVIGFLKPIILLPIAAITQLSTEQLETILLHELAHIKRYDYLVNILQTVAETILFFNPFVWLISSITRRERELCCDDMVLANTREPISYATALAALALPGAYSTIVVAATGEPNHLFNRIQRIMEMKKNQFSYSRMIAALLMVAAIACSTALLTPAFARPRKAKPGVAVAQQGPVRKETVRSSQPAAMPVKRKHIVTTAVTASTPAQKSVAITNVSDETQLVNSLMADGLVDQVRGFIVERQQNKLIINGREQPKDITDKYLREIKKENIRVQVYPFTERLQQHPDGNFIQILFPVQFASPCIDYGEPKEGC